MSWSIWTELMQGPVAVRHHDAGGRRTRALEAGSPQAPTLVFLHGTGGHAEAYARNLLAHGEHFHTLAIDMLGHGYSDRPDIDYDIDTWVDQLVALLDGLGVEQAFLSGESLGALVAAWAAIRHPERVARLVLNTGILAPPNAQGRQELADALERSSKAAGGLTREAVRARLAWLMADPAKSVTDELVEVRYRIYAQPGMLPAMGRIARSVLGGVLDQAWCARWLNPEAMAAIRCPTLVLWTRHNPGQPVELAEDAVRHIPDARLVVLEESAHWPQWEEPERFNAEHLAFLRS